MGYQRCHRAEMPVKPLMGLSLSAPLDEPVPHDELDETRSGSSSPDSSLGNMGRDSFRSMTSDLGELDEDSPLWGASSVASSVGSRQNHVHYDREPGRSRSNSHERHPLDFSKLDSVPPPSRRDNSSSGSRGRGGFTGGGGFGSGVNGGTHRRVPSTGSQNSGTAPNSQSPSSRRVTSPAAVGASVFRAGLPTCKASDSKRHASISKASKWDLADLDHSDSDDYDSLLDSAVRGTNTGRRGRGGAGFGSNSLAGPLSMNTSHFPPTAAASPRRARGRPGGGFSGPGALVAGKTPLNSKRSGVRRIMSEQHDRDETDHAALRLAAVTNASHRRSTMNPSRRRPSHLAGLNLRALQGNPRPKYDSAHMWHLQLENRAAPQTMSCSKANGLLFLDFDRTLAKDHTYKRSQKLGIKGLQESSRIEIVRWFGGEERLDMCKSYLNLLARMDIATIIITHGAPQLVYQMMRIAGFFPSNGKEHKSPDHTRSASSLPRSLSGGPDFKLPEHHRAASAAEGPDGLLEAVSRAHNHPKPPKLKRLGPLGYDSAGGGIGSALPTQLNGASTKGFGGEPVSVLRQNVYGIVAVYGQSADSAEKFLKSQCINEVCVKLCGKPAVR